MDIVVLGERERDGVQHIAHLYPDGQIWVQMICHDDTLCLEEKINPEYIEGYVKLSDKGRALLQSKGLLK